MIPRMASVLYVFLSADREYYREQLGNIFRRQLIAHSAVYVFCTGNHELVRTGQRLKNLRVSVPCYRAGHSTFSQFAEPRECAAELSV